jgi:hypothetical protein
MKLKIRKSLLLEAWPGSEEPVSVTPQVSDCSRATRSFDPL